MTRAPQRRPAWLDDSEVLWERDQEETDRLYQQWEDETIRPGDRRRDDREVERV